MSDSRTNTEGPLDAVIRSAADAIAEDSARTSNLWRTPISWPSSMQEVPQSDMIKVAGFVRHETGAFRVQLYEFRFPGEPYHHPRNGLPISIPRLAELVKRYLESSDPSHVPARSEAISWYLRKYEHPLRDVEHLYNACQLQYRGGYGEYWYGYTDQMTGAIGYGLADGHVLESLIWMARSRDHRDADRLHDLLTQPNFNHAFLDRYEFLEDPEPLFSEYINE